MTLKRVLVYLCFCIAVSGKNDVVKLKDSTWDEDTKNRIWMVKFMAPWCGHCKQFAPIFKEAASLTRETEDYVHFADMDCDANLIVCGEYKVTGYPTVLLLFNGKLIANYKESRDSAQRIKRWILKQLDPKHLRETNVLSEAEIRQIELLRNGKSADGGFLSTFSLDNL